MYLSRLSITATFLLDLRLHEKQPNLNSKIEQGTKWHNLPRGRHKEVKWVVQGKTLNEREICAPSNQNRNTECQQSQTRWNDYIRPAQFPDCSSSTTWVAVCQLTPAASTLPKTSPWDLESPSLHHGDHLHPSSSHVMHSSLWCQGPSGFWWPKALIFFFQLSNCPWKKKGPAVSFSDTSTRKTLPREAVTPNKNWHMVTGWLFGELETTASLKENLHNPDFWEDDEHSYYKRSEWCLYPSR